MLQLRRYTDGSTLWPDQMVQGFSSFLVLLPSTAINEKLLNLNNCGLDYFSVGVAFIFRYIDCLEATQTTKRCQNIVSLLSENLVSAQSLV